MKRREGIKEGGKERSMFVCACVHMHVEGRKEGRKEGSKEVQGKKG